MKNYIHSTLIAALAGAAVLTGCSLDVENKSNVDAKKHLEKLEVVEALRVSMYATIKPIVNETALTEWGTDLYTTTKSTTVNDYQGYKFTPEDADVANYYKSCYDLILHANELLAYCQGNTKYEAEAKFMRSLGYYQLTQQFGSVPSVDYYINSSEDNYPRTPLKDIYDKTIAELEGIKDCAELPDNDHNGNVSRRAVKALLAKVCLAAGWDIDTKLENAAHGTYSVEGKSYFEKAAQYAKETNSMYTGDCSNTDFGAVMRMLQQLDRQNAPEYIVVLSDMEFDYGSNMSKDATMALFRKNKFPTKIVWWNFNSRNTTAPETDSYGNIFISGYNPMLLKFLEAGFNANTFLDKLLDEYQKYLEKQVAVA